MERKPNAVFARLVTKFSPNEGCPLNIYFVNAVLGHEQRRICYTIFLKLHFF